MLGLDHLFHLFLYSFFLSCGGVMGRARGGGAPLQQQTSFILSSKLAFTRLSIGKGLEGGALGAVFWVHSVLRFLLVVRVDASGEGGLNWERFAHYPCFIFCKPHQSWHSILDTLRTAFGSGTMILQLPNAVFSIVYI